MDVFQPSVWDKGTLHMSGSSRSQMELRSPPCNLLIKRMIQVSVNLPCERQAERQKVKITCEEMWRTVLIYPHNWPLRPAEETSRLQMLWIIYSNAWKHFLDNDTSIKRSLNQRVVVYIIALQLGERNLSKCYTFFSVGRWQEEKKDQKEVHRKTWNSLFFFSFFFLIPAWMCRRARGMHQDEK